VNSPQSTVHRFGAWGAWLFALHLWTVFGLALSNTFLFLALVAVPWATEKRRIMGRANRDLWLPLLLYALFLFVSIAFSVEPELSRPQAREVLSLSALPLALIWVRSTRSVRLVLDGVVAFTALSALYGLGQFLFGYGELGQRIRGPFSHYMTFAGVLLIADLVLIAGLVCRRQSRTAWRWAALVVINLALVGSLTRSAWVALLLTLLIFGLLHAPKALAVFAPVAVVAVLLAPLPVKERFFSIFDLRDVTNYDRLCMAEAGLHMVAQRPLFGLGPEAVRERYPIYRQPTAPRRTVTHLHNSYVHLAAERGLTSLTVYLWWMIAALSLAYRSFRTEVSTAADNADLYLASFLALLGFGFAGLFEANWRDTELQRLALFLLAVPYIVRASSSTEAVADRKSHEAV
jgi:O-antigen ligase